VVSVEGRERRCGDAVTGGIFMLQIFLVRVRQLRMKFIGALSPHHLGVWVRGRNFTHGQGATYKGHRAEQGMDLGNEFKGLPPTVIGLHGGRPGIVDLVQGFGGPGGG